MELSGRRKEDGGEEGKSELPGEGSTVWGVHELE